MEPQPYPSGYKVTTAALGIYEETYFGDDELKITSTDTDFSSYAEGITLMPAGLRKEKTSRGLKKKDIKGLKREKCKAHSSRRNS